MESISLDPTVTVGSGETRYSPRRPHTSGISGQNVTGAASVAFVDGVPVFIPFEEQIDQNQFMRVVSDNTTVDDPPYIQLMMKGVYYIAGEAFVGGIDSSAQIRHVSFLITGPNFIDSATLSSNSESIARPTAVNCIQPFQGFAVVEDEVFDDNRIFGLMMVRGAVSTSFVLAAHIRMQINYLGMNDQRLLYG